MQTIRQRQGLIMKDHKNITSRHEIKYPSDEVHQYYTGNQADDDEIYSPLLPFFIGVTVGLTVGLTWVLWMLSK